MNKNSLKEYLVIMAGMFAAAVGMYFFQLPAGIVFGSITGLGMILTELIPVPLSIIVLFLNIACLLVGFLTVGKEFSTKTVIASVILPAYMYIFEQCFPNNASLTGELVLDGILAMLILGIGQAILFCSNACTGGLDILAMILNKYMHLEFGKAVAAIGAVIVISSIQVYGLKTVIIGLFFTYVDGLVYCIIDIWHICHLYYEVADGIIG